jgi:histidinol phosphatase-like PHP family hydrolase
MATAYLLDAAAPVFRILLRSHLTEVRIPSWSFPGWNCQRNHEFNSKNFFEFSICDRIVDLLILNKWQLLFALGARSLSRRNLRFFASRSPFRARTIDMPSSNRSVDGTREKRRRALPIPLDNGRIAILLAREGASAGGHFALALKRASRSALLWPEEAADLAATGRPLTELQGIGPNLSRLIAGWIESPPPPSDTEPLEFLTMSQARRVLAEKPLWSGKLKGDLHMHTDWSDGSATVFEMAKAACERGYQYIGITDHTKGLKIARGLDERRLDAQGEEIRVVNESLRSAGLRLEVLRSAEVNLSVDGEVDIDPPVLGKLDVVLGSFHSALRKQEIQTARFIAALRNPAIQILGHPQGRVYNYRAGLDAEWSRVFAEAARLDKAVEIDGYADRQDLKLSLLKLAKREGVRISLGTDAHHPWQLIFMNFSLAAACLAKIRSDRIINFLSARDLKAWVEGVRGR